MKLQRIYMREWLKIHNRTETVSSDAWYLYFANQLLPLLAESVYYGREGMEEKRRQVAMVCTLFLEDCVARGGNWYRFMAWHQEKYGRYIPFFEMHDDYYPGEINYEDVAFLLWLVDSPVGESFVGVADPLGEERYDVTYELRERLYPVLHTPPVSTHPAPDWLMSEALMQKERIPLPVITPDTKLSPNVERFLEASHGESLLYFDSYRALKHFFVHSLKWKDEPSGLLPELAECDNFVAFANPKGMLLAPDVTPYFSDSRNPLYDAERARREAYTLFCEQGACPFDLLKLAVERDLLPDAQFPFKNGKEMLWENWDFVARRFLNEYYEGE